MAEQSSIMEMVRRFAGADPEAEDAVLEMCYQAAVAWYEAAGVEEDPDNQLWLFWVCNLAAWMYDNRGNADANAAVPIYIVTSVHLLRKRRSTGSAASGSGSADSGSGSADSGSGDGTGDGTGDGDEAGGEG